jgi:ATP-binding cassette subfamily G (WHITE) protein 1
MREYSNGYYSLSAYFASKVIVELPFHVFSPILLAVIAYFLIGLQTRTVYAFFLFLLTNILLALCGNSMGMFFASVFPDLKVALALTPMIIMPLMLFSGLFVNNDAIPVYFDWIKYISPVKYGFEALFKNGNFFQHSLLLIFRIFGVFF